MLGFPVGQSQSAPLELLLPLPPAILYDAMVLSKYGNGALDAMAYDDHDDMIYRGTY
jgi:hypothetical protein